MLARQGSLTSNNQTIARNIYEYFKRFLFHICRVINTATLRLEDPALLVITTRVSFKKTVRAGRRKIVTQSRDMKEEE